MNKNKVDEYVMDVKLILVVDLLIIDSKFKL